ncbi:hypothetical protein M413DRAFT_12523 [Hebeloma cylindrosporum]|uniref:Uncharacterized protein n=1 Tax=Hebeloma cylindrosporum TaxID=76867 RepID=A0A0C2YCZ8_HEBCY|nr:hypothetical protein M413DRAFT_12523 [Hebeloma cylindrosporum h7]
MHNKIPSMRCNPNVMVALVHSTKLPWVPPDRNQQDVNGFPVPAYARTLPEAWQPPNQRAVWEPYFLRVANRHIRDLMDSLAGLSSNEGNPSVACALAIDYSEEKVEIIIASKNEVTYRTQNHIVKVWKAMVEISALTRSHDIPCAKQKSTALIRSIYKFCMPTLSKNFLNNISRLRGWASEYDKSYEADASKEKPFWRSKIAELGVLVTSIKEILHDLSVYENAMMSFTTAGDDEILDKFISTMDTVLDRTVEILALGTRASRCRNDWQLGDTPLDALGFYVNPLYNSFLRHILQDLISFPQHIEKLRKFYFSPHLSRISNYTLHIKPLNETKFEATPGPFPSTPLEWKKVYQHIHREKGYKFVGDEDAHDFSNIPTDPTLLVVHPELKIAIYLHALSRTHGYKPTPPFNYISASEFPCRACVLWIAQVNAMKRGHGVEVRGSSFRWPNDWRMPVVNNKEISRHVQDEAWVEYLRAQTWRGEINLKRIRRKKVVKK